MRIPEMSCILRCTCILTQQLSGAHPRYSVRDSFVRIPGMSRMLHVHILTATIRSAPHNRVRDSFICRLRDSMLCTVRDLFTRMLTATNRRSPNIAFVTRSYVELVTHSYVKVVTHSYVEFVMHACVEFVSHLYVTHS